MIKKRKEILKMKTIYTLIKEIVLANEPNAKDDFAALDPFFEWMPF